MAKDTKTRILITAKDEASGVFSRLSKHAGKIAAAISAYFGFRMFADATRSAAEFEAQMDTVAAVTRASAADLDLLKKAADEAGTNTRYTATEAAQALENLARAGLNARESVQALPAVLGLAQANGVGLAEASSLVTRAVRGMGLEVAEAGRVADVLTEAAARANTNVEGLGQALAYAAPTAQSLGLTLEDTVAIIGKFADAGIDASRAGTALNSILAQFSNPASKFRQELAAAGITTGNFNEALVQLAGAGPRGARAIIAVGQEAGPALRALLNQGIGSLDDLRGALLQSEGAAGRAAETMDGNLNGALRGLGSAWDAVRRAVVEPLLEPIADQVRYLADRLRDFVSNGTAESFGDAIRAAFEQAADAAREFVGRVNFDRVTQHLRNFSNTSEEILERWGARAASVVGRVGGVFSTLGLVWEGFRMTTYAFGEAITGVLSNITRAAGITMDVLSRMTFGGVSEKFAAMARAVKFEADALWSVSESFASKAEDSSKRVTAAWWDVVDAYSDTAAAAQGAADTVKGVTEAAAEAGAQAGLTAEQVAALGEGFEYVDGAIQKVTATTQANTDAAKDNTSALDEAAAAAEQVAGAYQRLGVESTAALKSAADNARRDFETIRDSGTASARDIEAAFTAYAEKAVAANDGVASAALRAEAAKHRLTVAADEAGRVTVQSMQAAREATAALASAADETASRVAMIGQAAAESAAQVENLGNTGTGSGGSGGGGGRKTYTSPLADLLPRAQQVGGLAFRKEIEGMMEQWRRRQSPIGGISSVNSTFKEYWDLINGRIEEEQLRREAEGSKFGSGPQRAAAVPTAGGKYEVSINFDGGRRTVSTASDADARELINLLQELQNRSMTA